MYTRLTERRGISRQLYTSSEGYSVLKGLWKFSVVADVIVWKYGYVVYLWISWDHGWLSFVCMFYFLSFNILQWTRTEIVSRFMTNMSLMLFCICNTSKMEEKKTIKTDRNFKHKRPKMYFFLRWLLSFFSIINSNKNYWQTNLLNQYKSIYDSSPWLNCLRNFCQCLTGIVCTEREGTLVTIKQWYTIERISVRRLLIRRCDLALLRQ